MRVAVVFERVDPEIGGGFTFSDTLLEAVQAATETSRHELILYSARGTPPGGTEFRQIPTGPAHRWGKGALRVLRTVQDYVGAPRGGLRTWSERPIEREGVEVVWFATNYAEECEVPFLFTVFDVAYLEHPWFPELSRGGEWERRHHYYSRFVSKAAAVIVPNEAGAEQLKRHFSIPDERILRLGHPTPSFALEAAEAPDPRMALDRFGIEGPYLFYPAQFWAHKNHLLLLEAIAELRRRGHEHRAVCVGSDRGQLGHIRRLATELGVEDTVHILGFVETEDLVALYRHADALVYPSFVGPESLPPLEAFALGCPVVAASVHGARQQLGDAALLVSPTDPMEVADAVERLSDGALRAELVERGRRCAEEMSAAGYVRGVIDFLDRFERIRKRWR